MLVPGILMAAATAPVVVPFDFSRGAIDLAVSVRGTPLRMILDTGVDPSLVDMARAKALDLKIDHGDGGDPSGFGDGQGAKVFPAKIEGLTIGGQAFGPFEALASDTSGLSAGYGRPLDGILGYSFLDRRIVLLDYPGARLAILSRAAQAKPMTATCKTRWSTPMKTVDSFPIIPGFRLGGAVAPVSLDTGSNGAVGLYASALDLPGVKPALAEGEAITRTGARGEAKAKAYTFGAPVGFGPFTLPPGQPMTLYGGEPGSKTTRVANVGNKLMAAMKLKVLFDYRARRMTFYGDCAG